MIKLEVIDVPQDKERDTSLFVYEDDTELKPEVVSLFLDKAELLNKPTEITIDGMGKNQFGRRFVMCKYNGEDRNINISKTNYNKLLGMFGPKISDWKGKTVKVVGKKFSAEIDGEQKEGVQLDFF